MSLAACAHQATSVPPPKTIAVALPLKEQPPADTLVCAQRPEGFPEDLVATMPEGIRAAAVRVITALKANADRQDRLINWHAPGSCGVTTPAGR